MNYLTFLRTVHDRLQPDGYLEVGVRDGDSLAQARCRCVGLDPAYTVKAELSCASLRLFRTTSDEFFGRPDAFEQAGGEPFDLAFIDGLHLFEFALRDFVNTERFCSPKSVIILDDILPRSIDEAARVRHTVAWTGDVYQLIGVLARYRPDLSVVPVNTRPTGLLLVFGLDPSNTVLADNYEAIVTEFRQADPQPVPPQLLDRLTAVDPTRILDCGVWSVLADASRTASADEIRQLITEPLRSGLGTAFVPALHS